jgi:hypothetical protein
MMPIMIEKDDDHYQLKVAQRTKLGNDRKLELPKQRCGVAIPKAKGMDQVAMNLRGIARCPNMM